MIKVIVALLLISPFTYASDPYVRNPAIDIQHYKFQIEVNDDSNVIFGIAEVVIRFTKPTSEFHLDLVGQGDSETGMTVSAISSNSGKVAYSHSGNRLLIKLTTSAPAESTITFKIEYSGTPADGLIIGTNKFGDRTFFGDNWPNRAMNWLPTIDHPSDKASCEFIVIAPSHYQVVGNGIRVEQSNLDKDRMLTHWKEEVPIPTKVMVIGIARFAIKKEGSVNQIPIETWVYPQNRDAGFSDFKIATSILDYFQQHIGSYPYQKLANVQSTTRFGGMENASNIFYFENSVTGKNERESLIAHEIAHQWFGDSASEDDWYHVWLSEGFATYFTNLYLENKYGRDRFASQMKKERNEVIAYFKEAPSAIIDTTITDINRVLNTNSYKKGGWFLHMLRHNIGDELFWEGIQLYYDKYKHSNAKTNDLRVIMEEVSGKLLGAFFSQWLERPGHPVLTFSWKYNPKTHSLDLKVDQSQTQLFDAVAEIGIEDEEGHFKLIQMPIDSKMNKVSVNVAKKPKSVVLDPNTRLLYELSNPKK